MAICSNSGVRSEAKKVGEDATSGKIVDQPASSWKIQRELNYLVVAETLWNDC